jgi:hypothetical protein
MGRHGLFQGAIYIYLWTFYCLTSNDKTDIAYYYYYYYLSVRVDYKQGVQSHLDIFETRISVRHLRGGVMTELNISLSRYE